MKSALFLPSSFFVKRLSIFSLRPIILRRFFFSFSSSNTRAASEAVDAFLMPFPDAAWVDVSVLPRLFDSVAGLESVFSDVSAAVSAVAFFLRFFDPGAFFRLWVRPCSASFWERAMRRCLSSSLVGRIGMIFSSA